MKYCIYKVYQGMHMYINPPVIIIKQEGKKCDNMPDIHISVLTILYTLSYYLSL